MLHWCGFSPVEAGETASTTEGDTGRVENERQENKTTKKKNKKLQQKYNLIVSWVILGWKDLGLPGLSCSEEAWFQDARKV